MMIETTIVAGSWDSLFVLGAAQPPADRTAALNDDKRRTGVLQSTLHAAHLVTVTARKEALFAGSSGKPAVLTRRSSRSAPMS
ncbi:MAG TPA: hypothetical protein VNG12_12580 [Acidimicrobiales bacterium]|nr:hypothetical protein [Acidimicrobiales bacterium]